MTRLLLVIAGGLVGAPLRYVADRAVQARHDSLFPWGTFSVNVLGSLVLGFLTGAAAALPHDLQLLVGTGFCGALTTFSTFQVQLVELGDDGHVPLAAAYLAVSVACGLLAAAAGAGVARR